MTSTKNMTSSEKKALQNKLDAVLAQAIEDVSEFTELYEIIPSIRITNNRSRVGSASVANGARLDARMRKRFKMEKWDKPPIFKISISTQECNTEEDIRNTLYHEVIHCAPGCFNHGKPFKALSAKVNAKYGTNVETSKKADAPSNSSRFASSIAAPLPPLSSEKPDSRALVAVHIGESFKRGRKTYTFTGFNENPKNCCDLMDSAGNKYKAPAELVAEELGVVSDAAKLEQRRRAAAKRMADVELRNALNKKIGKSFCDGRKTYTFIGFNSNPKNCCNLVDERGIPYKCALATLAHDFGIA